VTMPSYSARQRQELLRPHQLAAVCACGSPLNAGSPLLFPGTGRAVDSESTSASRPAIPLVDLPTSELTQWTPGTFAVRFCPELVGRVCQVIHLVPISETDVIPESFRRTAGRRSVLASAN
jgi:hypothetical protein